MATLMKLDINTRHLINLNQVTGHIEPNLFTIKHHNRINIHDIKNQYLTSDTFYNNGNSIGSDIHWHNTPESRIILIGVATFYIPTENYLYVAECEPFDEIQIEAKVKHWFRSHGQLLVYRFFKSLDGHVSLFDN